MDIIIWTDQVITGCGPPAAAAGPVSVAGWAMFLRKAVNRGRWLSSVERFRDEECQLVRVLVRDSGPTDDAQATSRRRADLRPARGSAPSATAATKHGGNPFPYSSVGATNTGVWPCSDCYLPCLGLGRFRSHSQLSPAAVETAATQPTTSHGATAAAPCLASHPHGWSQSRASPSNQQPAYGRRLRHPVWQRSQSWDRAGEHPPGRGTR